MHAQSFKLSLQCNLLFLIIRNHNQLQYADTTCIGNDGLRPVRQIVLNGNILKWKKKVRHLGGCLYLPAWGVTDLVGGGVIIFYDPAGGGLSFFFSSDHQIGGSNKCKRS